MARVDRTSETADRIIDRILDGELPTDAPLPAESEIAESCGVSRLTAREAIRLLQAQGVLEKVPGTRHRVVPVAEWTGLHAILRHDRHDPKSTRSSIELLEVRMMIETGAATQAATRRTESHLAELERQIGLMESAHERTDVDAFVVADLAFHDVILDAADNRVLVATMRTLIDLLSRTRTETSSTAEIREHAISWHRAILQSLRASDPERARETMAGHMQQTHDDLLHFVFDTGAKQGSFPA